MTKNDNSHLLLGEKVEEGPHGIINKHINKKGIVLYLAFTRDLPHNLIDSFQFLDDAKATCGFLMGHQVDKGKTGAINKHGLLGTTNLIHYYCYTLDATPRCFKIALHLSHARTFCDVALPQ